MDVLVENARLFGLLPLVLCLLLNRHSLRIHTHINNELGTSRTVLEGGAGVMYFIKRNPPRMVAAPAKTAMLARDDILIAFGTGWFSE